MKGGGKMEDKLIKILKKSESGLTITELVKVSKLSRSAVRIILLRLEGAKKVSIRKIGMAKIYSLKKLKNRRWKKQKAR